MLDLGGEANRRTLMARVNSNRIANSNEDSSSAAEQTYNAEEAKVQEFGDTGQGNRLTDAKKNA